MEDLSNEYKKELVLRYLNGESSSKLQQETGRDAGLILKLVRDSGGKVRSRAAAASLMKQAHRAFTNEAGESVKVCNECALTKPVSEFSKHKGNSDGFKGVCNECRNRIRRERYPDHDEFHCEKSRQFRVDHPETVRGYDLKKRFGLTLEEFNKKFENQGGRCAACGGTDPGTPSGAWSVDHDHKCCPNKGGRTCGLCVRGILCRWCNLALGNANEDPGRLRKLADYIESYG